VRSTPIEQKKWGDPWKVLCLGLLVLGSGTLRAQTPATEAPAETQLLNAANVYFGNDIKPSGELDLVATKVSFPIRISHNSFTNSIDLRRASLRILDLAGSHTKGLVGDGLNVERDVFLCCGFKSEGQFWLRSATIGGALVCTDGQFLNRQGFALLAEGARIGGTFFMNGGFRAEGEVRPLNAAIIENFECNGGAFLNEKGLALNSVNATFGGNVSCGQGFTSIGQADFSGAT